MLKFLTVAVVLGFSSEIYVQGKAVEWEKKALQDAIYSVTAVIDRMLEKSDDVSTSDMKELSKELLTTVRSLQAMFTNAPPEIREFVGKRNAEAKDEDAEELNIDDALLLTAMRTLSQLRDQFLAIIENLNQDDADDLAADLKALDKLCTYTREVALSIIEISGRAEYHAKALKVRRDLDKGRSKRNWDLRWDGVHWSRGNHDVRIGPTYNGGFGGGVSWTFKF